MLEILKRTTAVAALAALPLSPVAAQTAGSDSGTQGQQAESELVPSDDEIKVYKSKEETAPEQAEVIKRDGEYIERTPAEGQQTGATAGQQVTEGEDTQPGVAPGAGPAQHQTGQAAAGSDEDALIATVGGTEIRRSDVIDAIGQLPPQLQQQPPEMLIPMALDQLVTRELILQEAREANLQEDAEVMALAPDTATETARENAMVQVWLDRQMRDRVTDQKVQETYDDVKAQYGDQTPALEDIRPQIENELRQQAFAEISGDLQTGADITVYGPDGQPMTQ